MSTVGASAAPASGKNTIRIALVGLGLFVAAVLIVEPLLSGDVPSPSEQPSKGSATAGNGMLSDDPDATEIVINNVRRTRKPKGGSASEAGPKKGGDDDDASPRSPQRKPASSTTGKKGQRRPSASRLKPSAAYERRINEFLGFPFYVRHSQLYLSMSKQSPLATPNLWHVGPLRLPGTASFVDSTTADAGGSDAVVPYPQLVFPPSIKGVIVDIGTNMDPDSITDFWKNDSLGLLWFEPVRTLLSHPMHLPASRRVMGIESARVMGVAAAVAPQNGVMTLHLSETHGCTSLLPMNDAANKNPAIMQNSFKGSDSTFPDWGTSKGGFVSCIQKKGEETVPVIMGQKIASMISPDLEIVYISVDAQGFDMQVIASFGATAKRAHIIALECQDLPEGSGMFLTQGSFSCADIRACVEGMLPHRMVDSRTGKPANTCPINNPSHERNCIFRRMDQPYFEESKLPYLLKRPQYMIEHPKRASLQCPTFGDGPSALEGIHVGKAAHAETKRKKAGDDDESPAAAAATTGGGGGDDEVKPPPPSSRRVRRKPAVVVVPAAADDSSAAAPADDEAPKRRRTKGAAAAGRAKRKTEEDE